jgi:sirohydrochlorin cobaltochelatase
VSEAITEALARWLAAGGSRVGEVEIHAHPDGWELRHRDDRDRGDLELHTRWEDARHLANLDAAGAFRPLKTAPNLRRGWRLVVPGLAALRAALEYFYPAMTGVWHSHGLGRLTPVPLRETLGRQTGMYAITRKITDEQAEKMIADFCSGCLKHRLWRIADTDAPAPAHEPHALPLLCHEACNLLVAKARSVVKKAGQAP